MSKRNDEPKDLQRINADASFLEQYMEEDTSTDALSQYVIVPRLKVVQPTAKRELKDSFGEGAVIISPGGVRVAEKEEAFLFVPVFAFTEFNLWSDLKDKSTPTILARTTNEADEIAIRSRDKDRREESYGPEDENGKPRFKRRYVEHIQFIGVLYGDHPNALTAVTLGFAKGEFGTGMTFSSAIKLRKHKGKQIPLWSQVWQFRTGFRDPDEDRKWWGFDFSAAEDPLIAPEHAELLRGHYLQFREDFEKQRLAVDHSEADESDTEETAFEAKPEM